MAGWLLKSEPEAFAWWNLRPGEPEPWTGVRNHQARRNLLAMRLGDQAFFYHSGVRREIVGVVAVVREAYADPTASAGDWCCVDVAPLGPMPGPVMLAAIKAHPDLADLAMLRQSRLSVSPVDPACWALLCEMGGWRGNGSPDS